MLKLLTVIYDSSIEESMIELLEGLEVRGVTWIHDVHGIGGRGAKKNSAVFPGTSHIALIVLPAEDVSRIRKAVRRLQQGYRLKPGVAMFSQDVEELP